MTGASFGSHVSFVQSCDSYFYTLNFFPLVFGGDSSLSRVPILIKMRLERQKRGGEIKMKRYFSSVCFTLNFLPYNRFLFA